MIFMARRQRKSKIKRDKPDKKNSRFSNISGPLKAKPISENEKTKLVYERDQIVANRRRGGVDTKKERSKFEQSGLSAETGAQSIAPMLINEVMGSEVANQVYGITEKDKKRTEEKSKRDNLFKNIEIYGVPDKVIRKRRKDIRILIDCQEAIENKEIAKKDIPELRKDMVALAKSIRRDAKKFNK